jgi:LDH2 family malate/lactate/ureidoglycolate dehydrogenase
MIGVVAVSSTAKTVAPPDGMDPILGTNPIGVGIPTTGDPIVFDMATSKRAWSEIKLARITGHMLEKDTYLDEKGNYTTDVNMARSVVSMSGYKGFAIGLLIEVLTGSLADNPMGIRIKKNRHRPLRKGAVFMAIEPSFFTDNQRFRRRNSELVNQIKSSKKTKRGEEIMIPGERSRRVRKEILERGYFDVRDEVMQSIGNLL